MKSYETLRAVALLIQEGYTKNDRPTPHQTREMARGIVMLCDDRERLRDALSEVLKKWLEDADPNELAYLVQKAKTTLSEA